jgi:hypothetical protein
MTFLKPEPKEQKPDFESKGKIQEVIGFNKEFTIERAEVLNMVNYTGKVARLVCVFNKKEIKVHTTARSIIDDVEFAISNGMTKPDDSTNTNARLKATVVKYKTDNGTGYKLNYE